MNKEELVKIIKEHPEAKLMFQCGEDSWCGDNGYDCHLEENVGCGLKEVAFFDDRYYDDKNDLIDYITQSQCTEYYGDLDFEEADKKYNEWAEKFIEENDIKFEPYIVILIG